MATLLFDLIDGKEYLFNKNLTNTTGSTTGGSGSYVDKSSFNYYSGTTVPNTYLSILTYNNYILSLRVKQYIVSGSTATANYLAKEIIVNPTTELANMTITMPLTANLYDSQEIKIGFGGILTSGSVVRNLSIIGNTSQTILAGSLLTSAIAGDGYIFKWDSTTSCWHIY